MKAFAERLNEIIFRPMHLVLFLMLTFLSLSCVNAAENVPMRFDSLILAVSEKYEIDPMLVKALIWRESRFCPRATGSAGEIGLMQVKYAVAIDWAKANKRETPEREAVYDPYMNLEIGVWYLSKAVRNWQGNENCYRLALCEYNAGRRSLLRWLAHNDGSYVRTIESSASASYVKAIADKYVEYTVNAFDSRFYALTEEKERGASL